jgi:Flp pilus assembly protein TadD
MRSSIILGILLLELVLSQINPHCTELVSQAVNVGTTGDLLSAKKLLEQAVAICPDEASAAGNLGYIYAVFGDLDAAEDLLRRAVTLRPDMAEPWVNLGNVLKQKQDNMELPAEARDNTAVRRCYMTAWRLQPRQIDAVANLAGAHMCTCATVLRDTMCGLR